MSKINYLSNKIDLGERGIYSKNNKLNDLTGKEWVKFTKSWGIINPKRRKEETILHPAKFPEELVESFVSFFTKEGEVIFDPFLGTGSTIVGSQNLNRISIGIELNKKYADISKKRAGKYFDKKSFIITGDSSKIEKIHSIKINEVLAKFNKEYIDYIITSPPYWDMLKKSRGNIKSAQKKHIEKGGDETYSNSSLDLGNLEDYERYLDKLEDIFNQIYELLKPGKYLTIVIQNILIPGGEMIPVAWDIAKRLSKKYKLKQEKLWLQDNKRLNCWGYPSSYVSNVHHHYCLIFQKI